MFWGKTYCRLTKTILVFASISSLCVPKSVLKCEYFRKTLVKKKYTVKVPHFRKTIFLYLSHWKYFQKKLKYTV